MKCFIMNHKTDWEKGISRSDLKTVATGSDDINEVIKFNVDMLVLIYTPYIGRVVQVLRVGNS